ncbi:zinc carboxypeptidase family protein [Chrysochromulina tobinii]|uniref:Cytosolic carboxypeptidase-like protein 5 n=1 Tax=Chrysochromulina tobinii TaxID=1460289 RepID=A0A0M0J4B6_9EUKA|nr:zinc carboxypeptidase family protein [Chrysochromulina tobinii]|eukprot:KOO21434.1 zinc carboxypeptidase family protein [Chrysochromulina sp. CCMP291]
MERLSSFQCGDLSFSSDYDSGNASRVEQVDEHEFALWTACDAEGTPFEKGYRTWFGFAVRGAAKGRQLTFYIHNMNAQGKLIRQGMCPSVRVLPSRPTWTRIPLQTTYTGCKEEDNFVLRFRHKMDGEPDETTYFAFCFPHGSPIEAELKAPPGVYDAALAAAASAADGAASVHCSEIAVAAVQAAASVAPPYRPGGVYYHRELLTRSLEGRRIDLITLSGTNGMLGRTEEPLRQTGLMPEGGSRARSFGAKPVFMLTARVHPGETPASHVFDGFVNFLLREHDPRARALRERFVFKLIPMINPDGVYRGHYRADTRGANLNRCYLACPFETHPSVNAIAALVRHLHAKGVLSFYIDTHGHATKRGCFLFGNALPETERMVDNVLYAKLVGANCRWFDFGGCVFTERNMYGRDKRDGLSKEGSGRVAVYKMTGLTHVYTLECNYNMGRTVTRLQPPHIPKGIDKGALSPPPPPLKSVAPKYTPDSWRDVGKALALAALDMLGCQERSGRGR